MLDHPVAANMNEAKLTPSITHLAINKSSGDIVVGHKGSLKYTYGFSSWQKYANETCGLVLLTQ